MIVTAREGATTWLPDVTVDQLPSNLPAGLTVRLRTGQVGIEVQGLVGALPLRDGRTLQIVPKVGEANFLRMLLVSQGNQGDLRKRYDDFVQYASADGESLMVLIARRLVLAVDQILRKSPRAGRRLTTKVGTYAMGTIEAIPTEARIRQRRAAPVVYRTHNRTYDTPENRLLSEALIRVWNVLSTDEKHDWQGIFDKWLMSVPRSSDPHSDLERVQRMFARDRLRGPRDYYQEALMLAEIALGARGLDLATSSERWTLGEAALINTALVYEEYLRTVIRAGHNPLGFHVAAGSESNVSLYSDGTHTLNPDIVISRNGAIQLIADAKYKVPDTADHYQMYTYLKCFGLKRGVLISPTAALEERVRRFRTQDDVEIYELFLPLGNLEEAELILHGLISRFRQ